MNACFIQRLITADNTQETCTLGKGLRAKLLDLLQLFTVRKTAMCIAVIDDLLGNACIQTGNMG